MLCVPCGFRSPEAAPGLLKTRYSKNRLSQSRRGPSRPVTCSCWGTKNVSTRPGSKGDILARQSYVGFAPESRHRASASMTVSSRQARRQPS